MKSNFSLNKDNVSSKKLYFRLNRSPGLGIRYKKERGQINLNLEKVQEGFLLFKSLIHLFENMRTN
ncbi:hypothetical protein BpHYR1_015606 [Brachionus plicatilis]|uniref:Uncharacterized protein n=1 Tax=Brachionus plicatilis TaxID=10195 RepID=A0A3M7PRF6_BRAPC|nr:hypothetical protein BpHYR1_015606 [Brachionus plicatilis]